MLILNHLNINNWVFLCLWWLTAEKIFAFVNILTCNICYLTLQLYNFYNVNSSKLHIILEQWSTPGQSNSFGFWVDQFEMKLWNWKLNWHFAFFILAWQWQPVVRCWQIFLFWHWQAHTLPRPTFPISWHPVRINVGATTLMSPLTLKWPVL